MVMTRIQQWKATKSQWKKFERFMDQTERCESDDAESREETLRMELQDSKSQIQKLSEMMKEMTEKLEKMQGGKDEDRKRSRR